MFKEEILEEYERAVDINNMDILTAANYYYDLGLNILPLKHKTKIPIMKWESLQNRRLPRSVIERLFRHRNLGVITGRSSMNLFVLDCDDQNTFNEQLDFLESDDLARWVVSTHRGGHIWLMSNNCEVNNYKDGKLEIWGKNHYVLAPPSVHEKGDVYMWKNRIGDLPPILNYEAIAHFFPYLDIRFQNISLPSKAHRILVLGDTSSYPSNSEAENAAVWSLVRAGYDDELIIQLFYKYCPPHFAERNESEDWLIEFYINPAREKIKVIPYQKKIRNAVHWVNEQPWKGRAGSSDRLILLALCERARLEGLNNFRATQREVVEISGLHRSTVKKSIKRLIDYGFIARVNSKGSDSQYLLSEDLHNHPINVSNCNINGSFMSLKKHDIWQPKALGRTSLEIYEKIVDKALSLEELEKIIGKHKQTIIRAIKEKLEKEGLATQKDNKWIGTKVDEITLDQIAEKFGTLGTSKRRKKEHEKERENFAYYQSIRKCQKA